MCYATLFRGDSWLKMTDLTFHNFQRYGCWIYDGGSYNEISHCRFTRDDAYDMGDRVIIIGGSTAPWSTHNWIHHNYFQGKHNTDPCSEAIDIIKVGGAQGSPAYSEDDYNTIEYNYAEYSAHCNIVTFSKHNVIRGNISHNEPWLTGCSSYLWATSDTPLELGTGRKTFWTQPGLGMTPYFPITLISDDDYLNAMYATVVTYDNATGETTANFLHYSGTGTHSDWTVSNRNAPFYTDTSYNYLYSHRVACLGDSDLYHDNLNLCEGNRFGFAGVNPQNYGADCLDVESPGNIVRFNDLYNGMATGIFFKSANGEPLNSGGVNNRVYNNTVYHCGYGHNHFVYSARNIGHAGQCICQYSINGGATHNVIKNNIAYDGRDGDIARFWSSDPPLDPKPEPWGGDIVENNLTGTDPLFVNPDLTDPLSQSLFSDVHGYAAIPVPDLRLQPGSPAINAGTYLTQAAGAGNASLTLVVDDARYFQDGTWGSELSAIEADTIAVGTVGNTAQILSIDRSTNTITLAAPLTWVDDASVWLYKKSDGVRVLYGAAPDIGAHPFESSDPAPVVVTLAITPAEQTVRRPASAIYAVSSAAPGASGSVSLSVAGLPAGATATFAANPIAADGGATTLTINTNGIAGLSPDGTDFPLVLMGT
jgi:hypothetical protein